ncbi:coiled-coil domain-containing protein 96 [Syngnathus typhle]|uniref:coiled-coil domain-containing protein 96 n=1 Tax=Syngnathus typhle TaxID=161592 RepID=UPI002A6A3D9D|nr:coiled-coil domain-containing protein 96 [Syngnathus typhle]
MLLLQKLEEENHKVSRRNMEVQAQLAIHLRRTTPPEQDPEPDMKEYHECLERLTELRKQRASQMGRARQKEEELRLNNQEAHNAVAKKYKFPKGKKIHYTNKVFVLTTRDLGVCSQVETEWRFLLGLKRKLAVSLLREHLPPGAVRAKVDAALGSEQLRRQELRKLRLTHAGVESRVVRLEAKLVEEEEEEGRDLLQRQFKHLLAQRMQQRKADERRSQEASKLQRNIKRTLELLCNIKEKLHWSQTEVQTKREQLAQLEVELTSKRDLLYRTKRAASGLQRENVELKQTRGLLGNTLLLWDFGVTMGDAQRLEDKLEKLKRRREEIASA